ncbi:hypothetical protein V1520DRAFT_286985 [Lipomyces starkeyi]|uniref:Eukaryotic translation initiation factor 3 subunit M n=1 Tax=Lipomyces starkeyi NRRL Y-11557 TaxID=675824 RepID=A0A1E3Q9X0_LIPST|nr:hypothetical protein LIPSTDRAFT_2416 [Lipomyces starkeyi NRRL Y-11557]
MEDPSLYYNQGFLAIVGSPSEHVTGLAAFIDVLSGFVAESEDQLGPLTSDVAPLVVVEEAGEVDDEDEPVVEPEKLEEAIVLVLGSANALVKASDREFEPAYNLLLHVLTFSPAGLPDHLAKILDHLSTAALTHPLPTLSVLTNLFNLLPVNSSLRHSVFLTVLNVAVATGNTSLLLPQLNQLPIWFEEWQTSPADQVALLLKIGSELEPADTAAALKYLQEAHSVAVAASVQIDVSVTSKMVVLALKDSSFLDYDSILPFAGTVSSDLVELLKVFVAGTLADYKTFSAAHSDVFSVNDLDPEALATKIRLLTLSTLAGSSLSLTVSYSSIASALEIPEEEVEFWIIDVIRAGLLQGKMSQLERKLFIHQVATRTFGEKEWTVIAQQLDVWKQSLRDVLTVVRNARVTVENKVGATNAEHEKVNGVETTVEVA